jgi:predicted oxidoreductase
MLNVTLPGTELSVSRLAFGTAGLHHLPWKRDRLHILCAAADLGFTHFDTSPYYGFGIAERELGRFLHHRNQQFTIASKIGIFPPGGRNGSTLAVLTRKCVGRLVPSLSRPVVNWSLDAAQASLDQTLRSLGRDHIDILFLHEPTPKVINPDAIVQWMSKQKSMGKIRYWGLAGPMTSFLSWLNHPLAQVLQVRDVIDTKVLLENGRKTQLTYGALSRRDKRQSIQCVIGEAFRRNACGAIVVSARNSGHLRELAKAAESACSS